MVSGTNWLDELNNAITKISEFCAHNTECQECIFWDADDINLPCRLQNQMPKYWEKTTGVNVRHLKDVMAAIAAQVEYCLNNKVPYVAPCDGFCFYCRKQIYEAIGVEVARNKLITECPYCHESYMD